MSRLHLATRFSQFIYSESNLRDHQRAYLCRMSQRRPQDTAPIKPSFAKAFASLHSSNFNEGPKMIVTTTPSVEGQAITGYHGVVVGEAILGANVFRDIFASITDIVGGRSGAYEEELGRARDIALRELEERAVAKGANAVVGVDLDYEVINNMLMVSASGTAVTIS